MFSSSAQEIIVFIVACTILILLLITFITVIIYRYQQKQNAYYRNLKELKVAHENELLQSQLEMQEQTFQHISREIHDNIGQKLSLAKLNLNTLTFADTDKVIVQVNDTVNMISESINDLSDISRSMSSEIVLNNGLIKALEFEKKQLEKSSVYKIELVVTGEPVFMEAERELVLFRIAQEALNNIVKHATATTIIIELHYDTNLLNFDISDNGKGFSPGHKNNERSTGLINMTKRANMLNGKCTVVSQPGIGTMVKIEIPLHKNNATL